MIEYRCPTDGALFFKAEAPLATTVQVKCGRCRELVQPVAREGSVLHRTYECSECGRTQHCEKPKNARSYCIVCGTPSLVITNEVPAREPLIPVGVEIHG